MIENKEKKRHAYALVVHNNLWQLNKLIELLDHERNDLFIHIDKKSILKEEDIKTLTKGGSIRVYKEIKTYWSDCSLTQVEIFLIEKIRETKIDYEYIHMLSGADLPLKSQDEILSFYDENKGKEFVEYQIDGKFLDKPYRDRIKYFHVLTKYYRNKNKLIRYFSILVEYLCLFFQAIFGVNRLNKGEEWARGSNWFDITLDLADYVLSKKEEIERRFKMTRASDESFLPLVVHNSSFRDKLYLKTFDGDMRANMRYIDWKRGDPYTFLNKDYDDLVSSKLLFARKFDQNVDKKIIERMFEFVKNEEAKS